MGVINYIIHQVSRYFTSLVKNMACMLLESFTMCIVLFWLWFNLHKLCCLVVSTCVFSANSLLFYIFVVYVTIRVNYEEPVSSSMPPSPCTPPNKILAKCLLARWSWWFSICSHLCCTYLSWNAGLIPVVYRTRLGNAQLLSWGNCHFNLIQHAGSLKAGFSSR